MNKFFIRKEAAAGKRILANTISKGLTRSNPIKNGGVISLGDMMADFDKAASYDYYRKLKNALATRQQLSLERALRTASNESTALKGVRMLDSWRAQHPQRHAQINRARNIGEAFRRSIGKSGYPGQLESLGLLAKNK